ncbi:hypothetical protein [Streptomyces sp.]|uniref:hypothetical protein n=1 Tax=Streptomyces sp. TaxID=1931 RepID=UPI002F40568B
MGPAWAAVACAVTALLISPVSWTHHWVWAVPMVVLLAAEAVRRHDRRWLAGTVAAGVVFCSYAIWLVPHGHARPELRQQPAQMLLSALYPLAGLAFLAVAGALAVRALYTTPSGRGSTAERGYSGGDQGVEPRDPATRHRSS